MGPRSLPLDSLSWSGWGGNLNLAYVVLLVSALALLGLLLYVVIVFNGFVRMRNTIRKSWANVDVLLRQRSNEVPNLIACVQGYMVHERSTLESLAKARSEVLQRPELSGKAQADSVVTESLRTVFAVAEGYPELKANQNFMKLQERITGLENELADRREFYNDAVTRYNIRIHSFPDLLIARALRARDEPLFKATEDDARLPTYRP